MSSDGDAANEPRRPEGVSPGQPPHRVRVYEGPEASLVCVVCSEGGDPGEFLACPFHEDEGALPVAVCAHCYSRPMGKVGDMALVQKAGAQAGLLKPLNRTFGSESRPVREDSVLIGHVCYAPEKPFGEPFDSRAGFICAEHADQGCRYVEGEAVRSTADPLPPSEHIEDLRELLGAAPLDAAAAAGAHVDRASPHSMGVQSLLDLLSVDETDQERRVTLQNAAVDGVLPKDAANLAASLLRWDPVTSRFGQPHASGDEWQQYSSALQELLARQSASPVSCAVPLKVELEKFRARAVIWSLNPAGRGRMAETAASLSNEARTVLTVVGYSPELRRFGSGDPAATADSLERLRIFLASPSPAGQAAAPQASRARPSSPATASSLIAQDLKDLGLDPEMLEKRSFQEAARAARLREVAPLPQGTLAASRTSIGPPMGRDQPQLVTGQAGADALSDNAMEAYRLKDIFSRVLVDSERSRCTGDSPSQAALSLCENRMLLKYGFNAGNAARGASRFVMTDGDEESATLPGGMYLSAPGPPLVAVITFMQHFTAEQLKVYFKTTGAYIGRHEPQLGSLWKRVHNFVKGRSAYDTYTQFQVYAPKPPATELAHVMALGRMLYLRTQVLTTASADQPMPTLDDLVVKLESHCRHQESLGISQQRAALQLFGLMGLNRAAKAGQALGVTGPAGGQVPIMDTSAGLALGAPTAAEAVRVKVLTSAWVGVNSTKVCSNCAGSHQLATCVKPRRSDLPCQLCYSLRGVHHERDCCSAPLLDAAGQAEYSRLRYLFWAAKNGADATAHGGAVDGSAGNC